MYNIGDKVRRTDSTYLTGQVATIVSERVGGGLYDVTFDGRRQVWDSCYFEPLVIEQAPARKAVGVMLDSGTIALTKAGWQLPVGTKLYTE